jgi:hypothetical protein
METQKPRTDSFTNQIFGLEGYIHVSLGPGNVKEEIGKLLSRHFDENCVEWEIVHRRGYGGESPSSWIVRFVGPSMGELYESFPGDDRMNNGILINLTYLGTSPDNLVAAQEIFLVAASVEDGIIWKHLRYSAAQQHSGFSSSGPGGYGSSGSAGILPHPVKVNSQLINQQIHKWQKTQKRNQFGTKSQNRIIIQQRKTTSNYSSRPKGRGR